MDFYKKKFSLLIRYRPHIFLPYNIVSKWYHRIYNIDGPSAPMDGAPQAEKLTKDLII